jgi:hypothetical protein
MSIETQETSTEIEKNQAEGYLAGTIFAEKLRELIIDEYQRLKTDNQSEEYITDFLYALLMMLILFDF